MVTDLQINYGGFTLTVLAGEGVGEGEGYADAGLRLDRLEPIFAPLGSSRLSLSDWTGARSTSSAPVAVVERPRVSTSQLSWERRIDDAIVDLTGDEEELLLDGIDDLGDSIDGLL